MRTQAIDDDVFVSLVHLFLHFFQGEVNDVVMVDLLGRDGIAETQPKPVEKIHFVGREVRRVRSEDFVKLVSVRQMDFEVELRLGIAELFPGFPDLPRLLFIRFFRGTPHNNCAGLQRCSGTQNTVPQIVRRNDRKADGFAALFRHRARPRRGGQA